MSQLSERSFGFPAYIYFSSLPLSLSSPPLCSLFSFLLSLSLFFFFSFCFLFPYSVWTPAGFFLFSRGQLAWVSFVTVLLSSTATGDPQTVFTTISYSISSHLLSFNSLRFFTSTYPSFISQQLYFTL